MPRMKFKVGDEVIIIKGVCSDILKVGRVAKVVCGGNMPYYVEVPQTKEYRQTIHWYGSKDLIPTSYDFLVDL
jgi:hypothetical protein